MLALAVLPNQALATWLPDGVLLNALADGCKVAPDGRGGAYVMWRDYRNPSELELYGTRVAGDGTFAPGWPAEGTPICVAHGSNPYPFGAAPDGFGGAFFVWEDARNGPDDIYVQRMMPDGTIAPGWPVNGAQVANSPYGDFDPAIAPDGKGGVFVAWYEASGGLRMVAAQHLTLGGTVAEGWPTEGVLLCDLPSISPLSVMADGAGGAVVAWRDFRRGGLASDSTFDIYAQRLTAAGTIAPGWAVNGLLLAPNASTPIVLPDPTGGFYLIAGTPAVDAVGDQRYTVLRFTLDGTPAPAWPAGGVVVCSPSTGDRQSPNAVGDGFGGRLMDWSDDRSGCYDIYASRVMPSGALTPGFPQGGLRISDPGVCLEALEPAGEIAADGRGGGYFVWRTSQSRGSPSFIQHVTGAGTVAPGWPQYGLRMASTCGQAGPQVVGDGFGGAVVAWYELDGICSRLGVFAQRYVVDGVVATALSLVSADATPDRVSLRWQGQGADALAATVERRTASSAWIALGPPRLEAPDRLGYEDRAVEPGGRYAYRLRWWEAGTERTTAETWVEVPVALTLALEGARPNPGVGPLTVAFTLPHAEPATLDLLDVSGREVLSREVGSLGAGRHLLRLGECGCMPPGMYWLRLAQAGRSLVKRVAIVK